MSSVLLELLPERSSIPPGRIWVVPLPDMVVAAVLAVQFSVPLTASMPVPVSVPPERSRIVPAVRLAPSLSMLSVPPVSW